VGALREDNGFEDLPGFDFDRWEKPYPDEIHSYAVSPFQDTAGRSMERKTDLLRNEISTSPSKGHSLVREKSHRLPMDGEYYVLHDDGHCFHEILRFKYNEGCTRYGSGYYYLLEAAKPMTKGQGIALIRCRAEMGASSALAEPHGVKLERHALTLEAPR
jgi:hypothetical protein